VSVDVPISRLAGGPARPHNGKVEDEDATALMLEALFEIRGRVRAIHYAVVEDDDGEEEEEAENDT
jgi:hypothetical protein